MSLFLQKGRGKRGEETTQALSTEGRGGEGFIAIFIILFSPDKNSYRKGRNADVTGNLLLLHQGKKEGGGFFFFFLTEERGVILGWQFENVNAYLQHRERKERGGGGGAFSIFQYWV